MTPLEDELRAALRTRAQSLRVPERPTLARDAVKFHHPPVQRWLIAAACLALVVAGVVALAQRRGGDPEPAPPIGTAVPDTATPGPTVASSSAPVRNGWLALDAAETGDDIYLIRPGQIARRLEVAGSDTGDDACPSWSPDGTRLLFGRVSDPSSATPSNAELVIVPVDGDGGAGTPTVIALDGFNVLDGFDPHPCGVWAPDGRWVAFAGTGEVWLVDTQTSEIRHLPDLRPSDLEWRPGTDQLAIAGDMGTDRGDPTLSSPVSIYSVSTGQLHQLGSIEGALVTWSPDGSMLAYQTGEEGTAQLRLVDADGSNERLLVADVTQQLHGVGPVWSPAGDRIAYQRHFGLGGERHDVVLVNVADGTQTIIAPPQTQTPTGPVSWFPYSVTWSPDGTTLLYIAFSVGEGKPDPPSSVIAVSADTPSNVTVLPIDGYSLPGDYSHRWAAIQMWGRQPG